MTKNIKDIDEDFIVILKSSAIFLNDNKTTQIKKNELKLLLDPQKVIIPFILQNEKEEKYTQNLEFMHDDFDTESYITSQPSSEQLVANVQPAAIEHHGSRSVTDRSNVNSNHGNNGNVYGTIEGGGGPDEYIDIGEKKTPEVEKVISIYTSKDKSDIKLEEYYKK